MIERIIAKLLHEAFLPDRKCPFCFEVAKHKQRGDTVFLICTGCGMEGQLVGQEGVKQ